MEMISVARDYAAPVMPKRNAAPQRRHFLFFPGDLAEREFPHSAIHGIVMGSLMGAGAYLLLGTVLYAAVHGL